MVIFSVSMDIIKSLDLVHYNFKVPCAFSAAVLRGAVLPGGCGLGAAFHLALRWRLAAADERFQFFTWCVDGSN